jgi:hypothetical protein
LVDLPLSVAINQEVGNRNLNNLSRVGCQRKCPDARV